MSEPPPPVAGASTARRVAAWARRLAVALLVLAATGAVAVALAVRHYEADLPSTVELKKYRPPLVTRVLARDGTLLGELFTERRTLVRFESIPPQMKLAILAAEDAGFYEHAGLNYLGMLRALVVNLRGGKRQGGSTITQQVVKNVLLTPERTFDRKMREVMLARRIEQELTKDEILELYLNHIYFGHGRYGVEEACRYYFGKSVRDVTLPEAALLAGLVKGPSAYSPRVDLARSLERRSYVLDQMQAKAFAPAEQVKAAREAPVTLAPEPEVLAELAPEAIDEAKRTLRAAVGAAAERGGYTITTSIDPTLQAAARSAVRKNLDEYARRHKLQAPLSRAKKGEPAPFDGTPTPGGHHVYSGVVTAADDTRGTLAVRVGTLMGTVDVADAARYNPKALLASQLAEVGKVVRVSVLGPAAQPPAPARDDDGDEPGAKPAPRMHLELGPQGALVAVDVRTREIVALVGSYETVRGGLDRASHAHRQPGSSFKPFVYSYAIHARTMTPATIVETNPKALREYRPDNYDESDGASPKRLREAVAQSVNVAAVWTLDKVGAANVVAWAHALGIESKLGPDLSLALGAYEVTPREIVGAYATFAAGGTYEQPVLVTKITGPDGEDIALPERPPARRVLEEAEAYVTTSLLRSVVDRGTGKRARELKRPIAGKTGTSNQAKDTWFVGYSTDVACAVWVGYDDGLPLGGGETGGATAVPAFVDFMREAHKNKPVTDFPVPAGIVRVAIDPETGLRAPPDAKEPIDEVFLSGTEPTETAVPDAGAAPVADVTDAGAPASPMPAPSASVPALNEAPPF